MKPVTRQVSAYLSAAVYQAFRLLYSAREKNPQEAFSLDLRLYAAQAEALMDLSLGKARFLLEGGSLEDSRAWPKASCLP